MVEAGLKISHWSCCGFNLQVLFDSLITFYRVQIDLKTDAFTSNRPKQAENQLMD